MELQTPLSSEELAELEDFLDSEAVPEECMNFAMLDGFLTCLVIGPDMVMPSEWMPVVWSDSEEPVFETMEQAERIIGLMYRHMNSIAANFMGGHSRYSPMLQEIHDGDATDFEVEGWCIGFMVAMDLRLDDWTKFLKSKEGMLAAPLMTLGTEDGIQEIERAKDPDAERDEWVSHLASSITAIYAYWLTKRTSGGSWKWKTPSPRSATGSHVSGSGPKGKPCKRRK